MSIKDEIFATAIADGKPSFRAYQEAGFTGGVANARRKKNSESIQRRVAEILSRREAEVMRASGMMAEEIVYARQTVIAGLFDTIERAKAKGDLTTMRQCYVDLGKDIGMFVERSISVNLNADYDSLSDAQLVDILKSEGVPLALAPPTNPSRPN
jgi:hypothetical protein